MALQSTDGPLPLLLIGLTVVSGLVDAVSYLGLGHVFVANMTGNVVFLGFVAGGAADISAGLSIVAIGAFMVGALAGSRLGRLIQFNPVYVFLTLIREPIIHQRAPAATTFAWAAGTVLFFAALAGFILAKLQRKLIFKL